MAFENVLYTRLSGFAGLTALVSTRIYPNILPQNTEKPAICYRRVAAARPSCFGRDPGNVSARFQFDIFAPTYDSALAVRAQLRAALKRWSNTEGTKVFDSYLVSEIDLPEPENKIHHFADDFVFKYIEA